MPLPNDSPANAIEIVLPWTLTLDASLIDDLTGAWYKVTTPAWVYLLSAQVTNVHPPYPGIEFYLSDGVTLAPGNLFADATDPIQQSVNPGTLYYIKLTGNAGPSTVFAIQASPNLDAPIGSILVPDDAPGGHGILLNAATGAFLRAVPTPAGEHGDVLPNGLMLLSRDDETVNPHAVTVMDAAFGVVATTPTPASSFFLSGDQVSAFYLGSPVGSGLGFGAYKLYKVAADGTITGPWVPTTDSMQAVAAVPGGATVYYGSLTIGGPVSPGPIKAYDILGSADLPDFAATYLDYFTHDIVVLSNGTVLAWYRNAADVEFIRHYSALGVLLTDYSGSIAGFKYDHICRNGASTTDFWLWSVNNAQTLVRFQRIRLSDGAVLTDIGLPVFEGGYGQPGQVFGVSQSCPFLITTQDLAAIAQGTITVVMVTAPSPDPGVTDFSVTIASGLLPAAFTLRDGQQQVFPSVPTGATYRVDEIDPGPLWSVGYTVSNASPRTAITVAPGETVIVTITNTAVPPGPSGGTGCAVPLPSAV